MRIEQRSAIESAMRQNQQLLIQWLTKKIGDNEAARDVAQAVFMRVWAYSEKTDIENPRALIFKTANNLAINELKQRSRFFSRHVSSNDKDGAEPLDQVANTAPSPEKQASLKQDVEIIMAAISSLPERSRKAFMLNRFDGLSYREIADQLDVSESSVEKYMIEALKRLRGSLRQSNEPAPQII
ncbi:RNA polymerase sigma factor [Hyphococcus flavus]|uniref:RNA polymerase sigma factor n=1 Tax=Hyphococcus flavus TaxID=1866326 RepID=A0AAF0CG93_9PROT|nr:RNA polymerase sigma factor [Hyphococcus flavus]WDI33236.1 RNA polymerase sigma factor [Hyphococcus flavus]